jgi:4-carboxymuconolactone decarboxylase
MAIQNPTRGSTARIGIVHDRLPPISAEAWTPEQRLHAEAIISGPRGALVSPFVPLLRSPELMSHLQRVGEYLRYRSAIGTRLSELAILLVAREWSQAVEWAIHAPIGISNGLAPAKLAAIAEGRRPDDLSLDESIVYEFCVDLMVEQKVADVQWSAAVQRFGEQGAIDLTALVGYYTLLAMVMNASCTPAPAAEASGVPSLSALRSKPFRPLKRRTPTSGDQ